VIELLNTRSSSKLQGTNSIVHGGILGQLCKLPDEDPGETQAQKYNTVHTGSTAWLTAAATCRELNHSQVAKFSCYSSLLVKRSIEPWLVLGEPAGKNRPI
jgi:hypothetical protein